MLTASRPQRILSIARGHQRRRLLSTTTETAAENRDSLFVGLIGAALGTIIVIAVFAPVPTEEERIRGLFRKGSCPPPVCGIDDCLARPELEERLKTILTPRKYVWRYCTVVGDAGTGKSVTMRKVCREIGEGVIFVPNTRGGFGKSLGAIFNPSDESLYNNDWQQAFKRFEEYAMWYKRRYDKVPVLVIDNVDNMGHSLQNELYQYADSAAEENTYMIVFICQSAPRMYKRKAHRTESIGKLTEAESNELLDLHLSRDASLGVTKEEIVKFAGGNIQRLSQIVVYLNDGISWEDIKKKHFV